MARLDRDPKILALAADLGLDPRRNPVAEIVGYCSRRVESWLPRDAPPGTVGELEAIVCGRLGLVFEEIHEDADLDRVIRDYVSKGDVIFATAKYALDNWTLGLLYERRHARGKPDQYVARIDCRGEEKNARRFFTRWHEIAHLLILPPWAAPPFTREPEERCPIERLVDIVAGEIGFYGPVFRPKLERCVAHHGTLSYRAIEDLRAAYCPEASFHATAIAAVKAYDRPAILVEARRAWKKHEDNTQPPKLRAVTVMMNAPARAIGLRIDWNMAVPDDSVIAHAFRIGDESVVTGVENLSTWRHSNGASLPDADVVIDASSTPDRAIAIVTLRTSAKLEGS